MKIKIQNKCTPFIGLLKKLIDSRDIKQVYNSADLFGNSLDFLADYLKSSQKIHDILAYNSLYGSSLFEIILREKNSREVLLQKLDLILEDDMVFIDMTQNLYGRTVFDYIMKQKEEGYKTV